MSGPHCLHAIAIGAVGSTTETDYVLCGSPDLLLSTQAFLTMACGIDLLLYYYCYLLYLLFIVYVVYYYIMVLYIYIYI